MSEDLIIRYCAPTLAGIKTGNLFNCDYKSLSDLEKIIKEVEIKLESKGVKIVPLRYSKNRVLIYTYRPSRLELDLKNDKAISILEEIGYRKSEKCNHLDKLVERVNNSNEFPHEIGLFLGYPPEDVLGFIKNKGRCSKYTGCWKVYGDADRARKLFAMYKRCTRVYGVKWLQGKTLQELTVAV